MKTIVLLTEKTIERNKVSSTIKTFYKDAGFFNESNEHLWVGKYPNEFEIVFTPEDMMDEESGYTKEEIDSVPFPAYLTSINYHELDFVKTLVKLLYKEYPSMLIDNDDGKISTVDEFLLK